MLQCHEPVTKQQLLLLSIILIVAALLRFYDLSFESLWNDELSTWKRASLASTVETIQFSIAHDVHPPGYQLFMYYWISVFGDSETVLRLPSAIFGVTSVLMIFLVTRRFFPNRIALASAWLLAISLYAIHYSREARPYALLLLLVLLIVYVTDRFRSDPDRKKAILLGLILLSAAYTHYFGLLFASVFLGMVMWHDLSIKKYRMPLLILVVGLLPWIPVLLTHQSYGPIYIDMPAFLDLFRWIRMVLAESNAVFLLFMLMVFLTAAFSLLNVSSRFPTAALLSWICLPWILGFIISVLLFPVLTFPNMMIALPGLLILTAALPYLLEKNNWYFYLWIILITGFSYHHIFAERNYFEESQKQELREAVNWLLKETDEQDLIFVTAWDVDYIEYYLRHFEAERKLSLIVKKEDFEQVKILLDEPDQTEFWHIIFHRPADGELLLWLQDQYKIEDYQSFRGTNVFKYELK